MNLNLAINERLTKTITNKQTLARRVPVEALVRYNRMNMEQLNIFDKENLRDIDMSHKLSHKYREMCERWYGYTNLESTPENLGHHWRGRQKIVKILFDRFGKNILLRHLKCVSNILTNIEKEVCLKYHNLIPDRLT